MSDSLADKLQIWGIEDEIVIFSDASLGFVFDLSGVDISCWADDRVNGFCDQMRQFLNALPQNIDLQFVQAIEGGNHDTITAHSKLSTSDNPLSVQLCEQRCQYLKDLDELGYLSCQNLSVIVRKPMATSLIKKPRLFSKEKLFQKMADSQLKAEMSSIKRLREDLKQSFESVGVKVASVGEEKLLARVYQQWNPTRPVDLGHYQSDDLRGSLLFSDAAISLEGFSLGEMQHRVISLKLMPDQTFAGMAAALSSLPFGSKLTLSIHVPDQQKELEAIQTQRRLAFSMVQGTQNRARDIDSEAKLEDLETLLEQMVAQGEKVFQVSLNILLRSTDAEDLENQISQVLLRVRELGGAEAMVESLAAFDIFCEFAFPNARASQRTRRMKTSNLADFLPVYKSWQGHSQARVLMRSRSGSLLKFDPFSSDLTNANQLVSGGSGAGKSFLTNTLMLQMLKEDPQVFIIDIGGSYKKLTESIGGQYIPLGIDGNLAINPFDLRADQDKPDDQKLKFLTSLIEIMTKEDHATGLPRLERSEIEKTIQEAYEHSDLNSPPQISAIKNALLQHEEPKLKNIGRCLGPWCGDTPFGHFVDRPTNVTLSSSVVCFDLKGLETYADLQAACLFIITDLVWRVVQSDRSTKKFLIFDECWKLLENDAGASFIASVFRTFRKYYASAIAISQTIDDFAKSKVANAILPNSSIKWVMKQKGADMKSLQDILSLNENELQAVESLHQKKGEYSEAFLMAGDDRAVALVESTPLEYWICTTDPRDLAAMDEKTRKHPEKSNFEILQTLAKEHPHGIAMPS